MPALVMEEVAKEENLREAFQNVAKNKGAPGPDRVRVEEVREHLEEIVATLSRILLTGEYRPGDIRRVWIPKAGGGQRGLGIPNVIDRIVQQATLQVMQPHYEPTFDESSHGFRPGRSCHTAIREAKRYVEEGYSWVVDIDLAKFFDTVNHQRLLDRLRLRIKDGRIILLIKMMLKAKVVMPDGLTEAPEEGTPQGGPLSPLLSNIVLDELDAKLRERGHRFVRYADDCNIYVRSEAAAQRTLESTARFIETRLKLKVNQAKSAAARPSERHFLGFRLEEDDTGAVQIRLSAKTIERIRARIVELTPRTWGKKLDEAIAEVNTYLRGWSNYFHPCAAAEATTAQRLDAHIRRRLRVIQLKQWKRRRTIARKLIRMGTKPASAWRGVYGGKKSLWKLSITMVVNRALRNAYFARRGLYSIVDCWRATLPVTGAQMPLAFVEP